MRENWGRACSDTSKSQPHGRIGSSSRPPSRVAVLIKAAPTQKAHGFALGLHSLHLLSCFLKPLILRAQKQTELDSDPCSATYLLCGLGQVTSPL